MLTKIAAKAVEEKDQGPRPGYIDAMSIGPEPRDAQEKRTMNRPSVKGGLGGALTGGALGAYQGSKSPDPAGAAVGGLGGALIGGSLGSIGGALKGSKDVLQKRHRKEEPLETKDEIEEKRKRRHEIMKAQAGAPDISQTTYS